MRRKVLSVLMIIAVLLCYMPSTVFADEVVTTNTQQIGNYYKADDTTGVLESGTNAPSLATATQKSYADGWVLTNKTISACDEENVFDITLSVSTKEEILQVSSSPDAAVVLVIDCSGSMAGSRLIAAKKAAQTFINSFASSESGVKRKVAIVRYSGSKRTAGYDGANTILSWTDASTLKTENSDTLCTAINNLSAGGATNTEAGLMLGRNLLEQHKDNADTLKGITNKNIILLTDGNPTLGVDDSKESKYATELSTICPKNSNGYSIDSVGVGDETTCDTHKDAEKIAKKLKTDGYGTYAVYVGSGNLKVDCETRSCDLNKKAANWLAEDCGFSTYSTSDDALGNLTGIFEGIASLIEKQAKAWILTDPMGANITFDKFITTSSKVNEFVEENGTITWDLKDSLLGVKNTDTGYTTYTLTYRVKLNTLANGYVAGKYYATNGTTKVTYLISKTENGGTTYTEGTAYFNVPSVKGFAGSLEFTKTDDAQNALPGATFKLTTADDTSWKMEATSDSSGKVKFNNIPSGHTYTLTETQAPAGYLPSDDTEQVKVSYGTLDSQYYTGTEAIVNKVNTTSVSVTKTWNDSDNQDGKRPVSIKINLYKGNETTPIATKTVSQDTNGDWKCTFENLTKYDGNGNEIAYTIKEDAVNGYTPEITGTAATGFTVTNTHTPEKTSVSGTKTWSDNNNQDGKRPDSITVRLKANGTEKASKTVTANDNWAYSFTDLPKYANGQQIIYTITEDAVTDYTTTYDGYNVTNSYAPEETSVTVTKVWNDNSNQDGKRPTSVTVNLLADGTATGKTVTLNANNSWTATFTDLDVNSAGNKITYTVEESSVPDGYTSSVSGDAATGFTITNTHTPETITVSGTKTWVNDDESNRPASVTIRLYAGSEQVRSATVTADNSWAYSFTGLPKYANGNEITYKITEDAVLGYTTEVTSYDVKNTYAGETVSVSGQKSWVDSNDAAKKRPSSITVELYANNTKINETSTSAANEWKYSFTDLPKYSKGAAVTYSVKEKAVDEYTASYSGYNITNTYNGETTGSLTITKTTNGATTPADATFTLTDGQGATVATATYSQFANGSYTFADLPLGTYTVTETGADVTGHQLTTAFTVNGNATNQVTVDADGETVAIINSYELIPPTEGTLTITKASAGDATTPDGTVFELYFDKELKDSITYGEFKEAGSHTFTGLAPGTYTVKESGAEVSDYTLVTTYSVTGPAVADEPSVVAYNLEEEADINVTSAQVAVGAGQQSSVAFTNTYTKINDEVPTPPTTRTFRLTLNKQVLGVDNLPEDYAVTVTVSNKFGPVKVLTLKANEPQTIYLSRGDYTLTENAPAIDGYTLKSQEFSADSFYLTYGGQDVTITNTYDKNPEDPEEPKDQDDKNPPAEPKDPSDDNGADDENESDVPKTGDSMSFFLYVLTAAGALLGLKKLSKRETE